MTVYKISLSDAQADKLADYLSSTTGKVDASVAEQIRAQIPKPAIEEPEPVWWTTDPAAAHAAAKVGVVYGGTSERLSWQIGEQLRPTVDEPQEFASVVRATSHGEPMLWQKTPMHGKHYWESETGAVEVWSELTDVEVLRVGLGEPEPFEGFCTCPPDGRAADCGVSRHRLEWQSLIAPPPTDEFEAGFGAAKVVVHQKLRALLAESITSERKNALEKAIQAVEELAP